MKKTESTPKKHHYFRNGLLGFLAVFIIARFGYKSIMKSDYEKYSGHGFAYMNGWSTTDFTGYHVYDGEKLNLLDHESSFMIENEEDFPVLDGAEACYPLYNAVAKTIYRNIGEIEQQAMKDAEAAMKPGEYDPIISDILNCNGKYVTFSNTVQAYERLIRGEVDLLIGARPSENQRQSAHWLHEQIETIPIGREAFVFFVEEDNPVESLTSDQLRAIYHGDITNWQEVGGKNQKIIAFQRPEDSGSQVCMKYFMGDVSLKEPKTFEYESGMGGVIEAVAQYNNENGALGYTFRYFLSGLNQEKHVRMLKVDGIEPSIENIRNGSYPITVDLVCAKLVSNEDEYVQKTVDFLLSDDGQELVEKNGYSPLTDRNVSFRIENEISEAEEVYTAEDSHGSWILKLYEQPQDYYARCFELSNEGVMIKGYLGTFLDENNNECYELFDFRYTMDVTVSREDSELKIGRILRNEHGLVLPDPGTVFVRQEGE